jgi:hypothetical protein
LIIKFEYNLNFITLFKNMSDEVAAAHADGDDPEKRKFIAIFHREHAPSSQVQQPHPNICPKSSFLVKEKRMALIFCKSITYI